MTTDQSSPQLSIETSLEMSSFQIKFVFSVLGTLLLVITAAKLTVGAGTYQCGHQPTPVHQLSYAAVANTASGPHRGKRQTGSEFRPIRIVPFFDNSVESLSQKEQIFVKKDTIQYVIDFFERALTVRPLQGNILFQRLCNGFSPYLNPAGFCRRSEGCSPNSGCGSLGPFPEEHLAACKVCDDNGTNCETIGQDGVGVENADFVLYVSANLSFPQCTPGGATLAFALPCQLERQYDRPVAGFTNICVNQAFDAEIMQLRSRLTHAMNHALVFNSFLYVFFRDENGNPRTSRDPNTGLPMNFGGSFFIADETTVAKKEVRRTTFPNGTFSYKVEKFVTPALLREGRNFFGCDSFSGVPIEDSPIPGTGGIHFEQRVFNNELMTDGVGSANAPISRFTLALYEDSGWYRPNYDVAEPLRWGMNQGCSFVDEGCLYPQNKTLRPPFCEDTTQFTNFHMDFQKGMTALFREIGTKSSCHYDRGSVGVCNKYNMTTPFDPNFQYFMDPEIGGSEAIAEYCPYVDGYISCRRPRDAILTINTFAETHGPNSRCVDIRIDGNWTFNNSAMSPMTGGACYEVYCDEVQGPIVSVMGTNYTCISGKEIFIPQVDLPNLANVITIVCPPCEDLCWDNLKSCTSPTTALGPSVAPPVENERASVAAIVLFCLSGVLAIISVVSAVGAFVLFWMRRKDRK